MRFVLLLSQTILLEVPVLAYYNEFDPHAAAWLEQLIADGEIAYGYVDRRSICDVSASELAGFTQCHFFAGIGGWSRALRLAGVSDDTPIWTGSCPCQPFSSAGKGDGFDDPRHLWPHFHRLISALRPARVVGEQVASPDALIWWDAVCDDLEGAGYAGWAADLCSAGAGGDHLRQRIYWVADTDNPGQHSLLRGEPNRESENVRGGPLDELERHLAGGLQSQSVKLVPSDRRAGPFEGFRRDADWVYCRDGKWRPVKPGLAPLVNALPRGLVRGGRQGLAIDADLTAEAHSMRISGYGNAIDPELAAMFLLAVS